MPAHNDVTGDKIKTGHNSDDYRDNYDRIFGSKKKEERTTEEKMEAAIRAKKGIRHSEVLELESMASAGSARGQDIINGLNLDIGKK